MAAKTLRADLQLVIHAMGDKAVDAALTTIEQFSRAQGKCAIILLKLTMCIKLETDWAKAAAKAIASVDLEEAKNTRLSQEEAPKTLQRALEIFNTVAHAIYYRLPLQGRKNEFTTL